MKIKEAFALLGLTENASKTDIKKAYRAAAKKWHPDINLNENARIEFEKNQMANEIIQAYFEYLETSKETEFIDYERLGRIKNARKKNEEKKNFAEAKLIYAIQSFRLSKKFIWSKSIGIFSFLLGVFLFLDFFVFSVTQDEPIQGIHTPILDKKNEYTYQYSNYYMLLKDRDVAISPEFVPDLIQLKFVEVKTSRWFHQIKKISFSKNGTEHEVNFYSFFNDVVGYFIFLLLCGIIMFEYSKQTIMYYFFIKIYNLYILPLVIFYVLFGDARLFRLFGMI